MKAIQINLLTNCCPGLLWRQHFSNPSFNSLLDYVAQIHGLAEPSDQKELVAHPTRTAIQLIVYQLSDLFDDGVEERLHIRRANPNFVANIILVVFECSHVLGIHELVQGAGNGKADLIEIFDALERPFKLFPVFQD